MMMLVFRLILVAVVIAVVFYTLRALRKGSGGDESADKPQSMVPCTFCDTHVPRDRAVQDGGQFFCSDEHLKLQREKSSD